MNSIVFIALLSLFVSVIIYTFFLAYRGKIDKLGYPILTAGIFFFFYIVQPIILYWTGMIQHYLTPSEIFKGIFVPLVMYIFFLFGWFVGLKIKIFNKREKHYSKKYYRNLFYPGLILAILGILLYSIFLIQSGAGNFYRSPHGAAGAWEEQTAYIYNGLYLIFPGLIFMILSLIRTKKTAVKSLVIVVFSFFILIHAILTGDRGDFFLLVVTLGLAFFLGKNREPKLKTVIVMGVLTGFIILLLVGYRNYLHLGPKSTKSRPFVEAISVMTNIGESTFIAYNSPIEFIIHSGVIEIVDRLQKYHFGINWVYNITVHLIPRVIWSNKPYSWETPGITNLDIESEMGWSPSFGSNPAVVGEVYSQFGWASIIFFSILGINSAIFLKKARRLNDPINIIIYILLYGWSYKLLAQGFGPFIVPFVYTLVPSVLVYKYYNALCFNRRKVK